MKLVSLIYEIKNIKRLMKKGEPSSYVFEKIDNLIKKLEELKK